MTTANSKTVIEIYSDGSAMTGENPGGWAFRVIGNGIPLYESSGHMERATNNDAELEAALQGLEYLKNKYELSGRSPENEIIYLVSDSQIILGWASGRFKIRQSEKLHKVIRLQQLMSDMKVIPKWVKGHSGDAHNVRCDKLAKNARNGNVIKNGAENISTMIGTKRKGTIGIWYNGVLKIVDLELNIIENYNQEIHGRRGSQLQLKPEGK